MKRIRIIGLCLFAAFAMSAVAVSSASAAAPEFGRCLKKGVAGGAGFSDAACKKAVGAGAKYEWTSTILKNKFTSKMTSLTAVLETVGGTKVTCTTETSPGEITGPKSVGGVIAKFTGCEAFGFKCASPGAGVGEIVTSALEGQLGIEKVGTLPPENNKLATELHAPAGLNVAEFSCAGLPVVVHGSVLHPATTNKMALTTKEKFKATKGEQKPDKFAGGVVDEHTLESNSAGGPFEEAGQTIESLATYEEKVEASSVN